MIGSVIEIEVSGIVPSPFQHRRLFDDAGLRELAKSIEQDGLIQPITVRPVNDHFELIAGERRWRAFKLANISAIPARILDVGDLQARRLCATENLQRADLTSLEEVQALAELVDASLLIEYADEYATIATIQKPKWRVRALLTKLDSDRRNGTDFFTPKFGGKVKTIFDGLPKPKDARKFLENDLTILFTPDEVQRFALDHRLNKSQTKAVAALQEAAPAAFIEISKATTEKAAALIMDMADPFSSIEKEDTDSMIDISAETIKKAARNAKRQPELIESHNHRAQGTGENEWYTPADYIEKAREVMGAIELDPATSETANRTVNAKRIYTLAENGLNQEWHGSVWLNPPYSQPHIQQFIEKLALEYREGRTKQAIALTHNYTDTAWFHHAANHCQAICFTRGRIAFLSPEGEKAAPTQGQAFFYFGDAVDSFKKLFGTIGLVVTRHE